MKTADTLAALHAVFYVGIAALICALIVGAAYLFVFVKDELPKEIREFASQLLDERKKRREDDDYLFTRWVANKKDWQEKHSPLW